MCCSSSSATVTCAVPVHWGVKGMSFVPSFIQRQKIVIYYYFHFKFIGQLLDYSSGLAFIIMTLSLMLALFLLHFSSLQAAI